jgi:hypothetical protein
VEHSLTGWDIAAVDDIEWAPWGPRGEAQAKLVASADGFNVVVVRAPAGYVGVPHVHGFPEFLYVIDGAVHTQGLVLKTGDAYAAAAGSTHDAFESPTGATYVLIFKL